MLPKQLYILFAYYILSVSIEKTEKNLLISYKKIFFGL